MVDDKGSDQGSRSRDSECLESSLNKLKSHAETGFQSIDQNLKSLEAKLASALPESNAQVLGNKGEPDNDDNDKAAAPLLSSTNGKGQGKDDTIILQRMNDLEQRQIDTMKQMESKVNSFLAKWDDRMSSITSASSSTKPSEDNTEGSGERKAQGIPTQSKDASTLGLQSFIKDSILNLETTILSKIGHNGSVTPQEEVQGENQSVAGGGSVQSELKAIRESMLEQQKKVEEIAEHVRTALDMISQHLGDSIATKLEGGKVRDHVESFGESGNADGERPSQRRRSMGVVELDDRELFRRMKGGMERLKFLLDKEREMQTKVGGNKEMLTAACKRWYNRHVVAVHHCYHTCHGGNATEFLLQYGENFKTNGFKCACSEEQQAAAAEEQQVAASEEQGEQQEQV